MDKIYKIITLFGLDPPTGGSGGSNGMKTPPSNGIQGGADDVAGGSGLNQGSIFGTGGIVTNIINWILYIVGIVSVVMIIVGGIRYATSAGNEKSVTAAKNTIIYALIGLAAALLAWVIVNFVIEIL